MSSEIYAAAGLPTPGLASPLCTCRREAVGYDGVIGWHCANHKPKIVLNKSVATINSDIVPIIPVDFIPNAFDLQGICLYCKPHSLLQYFCCAFLAIILTLQFKQNIDFPKNSKPLQSGLNRYAM